MLTEAIIKANQVLANLTPEQVMAIAALSKNDEDSVIANKYGEIYGGIDTVIEKVTGEKKPSGTKTTDWAETNLAKLKAKADKAGDTAELDKLRAELAQAKEDAKNSSGDKTLKAEVERLTKEVADEKKRVSDLQANQSKTQVEWEAKLKVEQDKMIDLRIDNEANAALAGLKFKDEKLIPKDLREIAIKAAKAKVLADGKADWIDDGNGGQRLVFRDANGQVRNNPENKLNPFTFGELLTKELSAVIDTGHHQPGAGTKPGQSGGGGTPATDVTGAKSLVEADDIFTRNWFAQGKAKSDPDYNKEWQKMRDTLPKELPMQ